MNPIVRTKDQHRKLLELCIGVLPQHKFEEKGDGSLFVKLEGAYTWCAIHWLELCLYHLLPLVAETHGKQPFTNPAWSEHMIRQKIVNNIPTVNPIDILYDIWKHPEKYAQDL